MVLVSQQPQPQSGDGEFEPLLQKDLQATPQSAPRPPFLKRALKVGGALIAIELLVYALLVFLDPRWPHFNRHRPIDDSEIYDLPRAVSFPLLTRTRHI